MSSYKPLSMKSLKVQGYDKRPQMPRAIELPTPIYGYTGEKRKEIIKGEKIDRSKRPIDHRIVGYTGYPTFTGMMKDAEHSNGPVKHPDDRLPGYTGFVPRIEREDRMLENIKPPVTIS